MAPGARYERDRKLAFVVRGGAQALMRHEAPACEPGSAEGIRFSGPDPVSRRSARRWSRASARSRAAQPPGNDRPASSASVWHGCQQYGRALVGTLRGRRVQVRVNSPIRMAGRLEVPGKSPGRGTGGPVEDEACRRCGPACLGAGAREPVRRSGGVRQAGFVTWPVALVVPPGGGRGPSHRSIAQHAAGCRHRACLRGGGHGRGFLAVVARDVSSRWQARLADRIDLRHGFEATAP
jgi:hypothetical protein